MELLTENFKYILIIIVFAAIIIGFLFTKKRHHYKIKQGEKILLKIRSFKGENLEERIINYLRKINPFTFEELLLSIFAESGCKIKRNKKYTGDGGIDGKFKYNGKWYYIQAKRYSNHIKNTDVKKFAEICHKNKVRGLFIHTGKAGKMSYQALEGITDVLIIHPSDLVAFILTGKLIINEK